MKNITLIAILIYIISSCGSNKEQTVEEVIASSNLDKIRTKRTEIASKRQELDEQIKLLDDKISTIDTVKHIPLITTFSAKQEPFNHYLELQGNVTTKNLLVLYPEFSGILAKVYVKKGQKVSAGQILAKIDDGGLGQQKAQLQINADLAKTTFERQERLWKQNIGSEIQYLQAKSNYEAQMKAIKQLDSQLEKTIIRAPFSGTIDDIITEQGSVVAAGQSQIMRIVNLNNMYIETEVPERYIKDVIKNKYVKVEIPVIGKSIDSKIRQTSDYINPSNRTYKIEVAVPNKDKAIKPNLTAKLKINDYTNKNAYLVPQSIISENAQGEQYLYIVKNINGNNEGIIKKVIIETGKTQGDIIEVLSGLETGTQVVQEGARSVKDGQTVKILENDSSSTANKQ
ncbi:efflux RND transporter periplasmic adaptor subunit [Aureibaculum marinum]|uniref:Efflux RND transporter periplasmic adaptor subunit n=1 Tax=Aureibaculum marinum TaxID=2487930 RepID=A0A3N4NHG8_9FLAO|nr:efflux RND transporter periplasmic adaptor subunit [Aureibaculum marinum]RPD95814.1 efflux RND transporter periplasmic adaptor subunit [Aureibaculum marinum]